PTGGSSAAVGDSRRRQMKQANSSERNCSLIQTSPQSRPSVSLRRRRWKGLPQVLQTAELASVRGSPQTWQASVRAPLIPPIPQDERDGTRSRTSTVS